MQTPLMVKTDRLSRVKFDLPLWPPSINKLDEEMVAFVTNKVNNLYIETFMCLATETFKKVNPHIYNASLTGLEYCTLKTRLGLCIGGKKNKKTK